MNAIMNKRILKEANYILETKDTIREVARKFNVSKSTVHKDLHDRLVYINRGLYNRVKKLMEYHKEIRHIRGGESTRQKYQKMC